MANNSNTEIKVILGEIIERLGRLDARVKALEDDSDSGKQLVLSSSQMGAIVPIVRDDIMRTIGPVIGKLQSQVEYLAEDTAAAVHEDRMHHLGVSDRGQSFIDMQWDNGRTDMLSGTMWGENF